MSGFEFGALVSARAVVGSTLHDLGGLHDNVWGLTADVGAPIAAFASAFPDRYVDVGIAEQNVVGIAAGLALEGNLPFIAGMAPFMTMRALEQNRTDVCYQDLPVTFVGWGGGLVTGGGSTHNAMEDIAIMKALVNMTVLSVGDPNMVGELMRLSIDHPHPTYIRLGKGKGDPTLYDPATFDLAIGKGLVARPGSDATIIAHGDMVWEALQAAETLAGDGIEVRVVDMYSVQPLDVDLLFAAVDETGHIVVMEDHLARGGLASSIADELIDAGVSPRSFRRLGTPPVYVGFGSAQEQWRKYDYDRVAAVRTIQHMLRT
ncbi:MAG: transketolase C-terminal domain-containing protein [Ilumatobacteraceae bacterium]